ncbi:hypothetical protein VOLCADRAFT_117238 [Volvox carteri f. nagariensis]|uniref:DUF7164 domain-containing protein n=1 Tax=Volvox carteri f. nagariensis TaxID=3068 RepID=D8TSV3_VOLCA|nr:uncharacterized protein VOLCADRAFT_117238 [Volvox carteri f. nagariensis]EFJ49442.1 hypothetical protein VOLCADRAFT_117238 [Volvox carteri f. nagariensis]|eukprot:XP_002949423.1 hypothetical protein VOLCADRAFT_117238 [Volvox carteri f. nagariensis]
MKRPRVIFGYLSEKDWAFTEFLCFMHASWRYVASLAEPTGYVLDLMVLSDQRWLPQGYPFVASYHFLADPRVTQMLVSNYGYPMKTDFDCFITQALIQHFPQQFEVGYMYYTPLPETRQRLKQVAARLGLRHRGLYDIGPTWYGDVATLIAVANASLPLVYYLLDREYDKNPDGSWRRNWAAGEGWPLWSKDLAVMYAPDLVINHMLEHVTISRKYDVHGDSRRYTFTLYHIHCQHGDGDFSKFEFFRHRYNDRDIYRPGALDFNVVRDYSLFLAASTWRQLMQLQKTLKQMQEMAEENRKLSVFLAEYKADAEKLSRLEEENRALRGVTRQLEVELQDLKTNTMPRTGAELEMFKNSVRVPAVARSVCSNDETIALGVSTASVDGINPDARVRRSNVFRQLLSALQGNSSSTHTSQPTSPRGGTSANVISRGVGASGAGGGTSSRQRRQPGPEEAAVIGHAVYQLLDQFGGRMM